MRTPLKNVPEYPSDAEYLAERHRRHEAEQEDAARGGRAPLPQRTKRPVQQEFDRITVTQLATRVPKDLYQQVKIWCVRNETSIADFVTEALRNELTQRQLEAERCKRSKH